jgi:hypothetical protein
LPARRNQRIVDSLPVLEGRLFDLAMTFRRDDIYGPDAGDAVFVDTNILVYATFSWSAFPRCGACPFERA